MVEVKDYNRLILLGLRGPNNKSVKHLELETNPILKWTEYNGKSWVDEIKWEIEFGRAEIQKLFGDLPQLPHISRTHWSVKYHMFDSGDNMWVCTFNDGDKEIKMEGGDLGHAPPVVLPFNQFGLRIEILAFFLGDFMSNNY